MEGHKTFFSSATWGKLIQSQGLEEKMKAWRKGRDKKTKRDKRENWWNREEVDWETTRGTRTLLHSFYGYLWAPTVFQRMWLWEKKAPGLKEFTWQSINWWRNRQTRWFLRMVSSKTKTQEGDVLESAWGWELGAVTLDWGLGKVSEEKTVKLRSEWWAGSMWRWKERVVQAKPKPKPKLQENMKVQRKLVQVKREGPKSRRSCTCQGQAMGNRPQAEMFLLQPLQHRYRQVSPW